MTFNGLVFLRHDPLLTGMSVIMALAGCLCALRVCLRLQESRAAARGAWIVLGGGVLGIGVWSADFLQLAGFAPGGPTGFDGGMLAMALLISVAGCTASLAAGWRPVARRRGLAGGLTLAGAFTAMRACALLSFKSHAHVAWSPLLLGLAVATAAAAAVAAFRTDTRSLRGQVAGVSLIAVSLWSVQLFSCAAATLTPGVGAPLPAGLLSPQVVTFLAVMIAAVAVLGGFGVAFIDDVSSRTALQRTRRLADAAREGLLVVNAAGLVLDANAAVAALAGCEVELLRRRPLADLLELPRPLEPGQTLEAVLRGADGEAAPVEVHVQPLDGHDGHEEPLSVVTIRDLREQRAVEERLRFLSDHDPLTGLPTRAALRRWVGEQLPQSTLLFYLRIANYAETNSLFGHAAGDAVLEKMAERLKRHVANPIEGYTCMAARLGGGEFAFAAVGPILLDNPFPRTFIKALGRPIVVEGQVIEPQLRMGVTGAPHDCETEEQLFRYAEVALDRAMRDDAVDGVTYFSQDQQDDLVARRTLIRELKAGLAEGQLVVHYQPQARADDGRLCGFEALVRWNHPVRGFMPPDGFIPAAEESGLIVPLGEQVLRLACAEAAAWPAPVPVAVNLSPLQVHQVDLPRLVHEVLLESGLPPWRLALEITESALFRDFQRALDTLRRIKGLGVSVVMDDFGTGFSSLSTLQSFPFDKIKIDKSFVGAGGERASVLVKAVLGIGRGLDIPVVAEGVETAEQLAFLREERCEVVQGYLIGRPAPAASHAALFDTLAPGAPRPRPSSRRAA